jgi:hypothetical protein
VATLNTDEVMMLPLVFVWMSGEVPSLNAARPEATCGF